MNYSRYMSLQYYEVYALLRLVSLAICHVYNAFTAAALRRPIIKKRGRVPIDRFPAGPVQQNIINRRLYNIRMNTHLKKKIFFYLVLIVRHYSRTHAQRTSLCRRPILTVSVIKNNNNRPRWKQGERGTIQTAKIPAGVGWRLHYYV